MRKVTLFVALVTTSLAAVAQLSGDGYYRVQNYMSSRYIYVYDNRGGINVGTSDPEMGAIELWKGFDKAACDPATVCYIKKVGDKYDIQSQGTGVHEIIDYYMSIRAAASPANTYYAYGTQDGITKYLGDGEKGDLDRGVLSTATSGDWRKWYIKPISASSDNYFGVKTDLNIGGKYYRPFYTEFPYSFASSGMKAYYISKVDKGMAVLKEVSGTIPGETPVFIEASSSQPVNNKLNIGGSASSISGNLLKGVYFNNKSIKHKNQVAYDAKTMRMLGTTSEGKLGYITASIDYIPANYSYLSVSEGTAAELKIVTEQEYNDIIAASIPKSITLNKTSLTLTEGDSETLVATINPSTADKTVTWKSDNAAVTVDANGKITAVTPGSATITVTTVNGLKATCAVTVKAKIINASSISLSATSKEVTEGDQFTLTATVLPENTTNKAVKWATSDASVATVENGVVKTLKPGNVNITATTTDGTNLSAACAVTVKTKIINASSILLSATNKEVTEGDQFTLTATVLPDNTTNKTVKWATSDASVATVENGVVKTLKPGNVNITATTTDGTNLSATCAVTVNVKIILAQSITLDKTEFEAVEGSEFTLVATVLPENTTNKAVKWETTNKAVATVDQSGNVKIVKQGQAEIKATTTDGTALVAICTVKGLSGIEAIISDLNGAPVDIHTLSGVTVKAAATAADIKALAPGFYIIGTHKVLITK